jgi:divalent metal cation (Fe/Co/Zn/Cd) transporter
MSRPRLSLVGLALGIVLVVAGIWLFQQQAPVNLYPQGLPHSLGIPLREPQYERTHPALGLAVVVGGLVLVAGSAFAVRRSGSASERTSSSHPPW